MNVPAGVAVSLHMKFERILEGIRIGPISFERRGKFNNRAWLAPSLSLRMINEVPVNRRGQVAGIGFGTTGSSSHLGIQMLVAFRVVPKVAQIIAPPLMHGDAFLPIMTPIVDASNCIVVGVRE
jgi:hypothetical protein